MANISLRSYNQEVERLIESGRTDEAVAHCRHILQTYPRFIDTYRLLGKSFLESQRYGDAADILQRVLSSIPDDFVAHVGMSIIREDEGNLDEAIWHMERAFEVQPSNGAIHDELRRLFERRDGVEPPKIRLNRGALARMYYKGELYQQAIAEIRAVLAKDPNRLDLQVLLAKIYAKSGQPVEAAETSKTVLRKLPNCMDANQVMAQVLLESEHQEEAQEHLKLIHTLDPYSAHIQPDYPSSDLVPEQTVNIQKLEWKAGETPSRTSSQPDWATSLGVSVAELGPGEGDEVPEWLSGASDDAWLGAKDSEPAALSGLGLSSGAPSYPDNPVSQGASPTPEEDIPDWMQEAGWAPSSGESEAAEAGRAASFDSSDDEDEEAALGPGELAAAEIPDWLQAMAPSDEYSGEVTAEFDAEFEAKLAQASPGEIPDWLSDGQIDPPGKQSEAAAEATGKTQADAISAETLSDDLPDWLTGVTSSDDLQDDLPDWLMEGEAPSTVAASADELPDWLMETELAEIVTDETPAPVGEENIIEPSPAGELPDWLTEPEDSDVGEAPADELPAWLLEDEAVHLEAVAEIEEVKAEPAEELPAWLLEDETAPPEAVAEIEEVEIEPEAEPAEELPAWLLEDETAPPEAVAEIEGFEIEPEAEPAEELPAWLLEDEAAQLEANAEIEEVETEPEAEPAEELPAWLLEDETAPPEAVAEIEEVKAEPEAEPADELPAWLLEDEAAQLEAVAEMEEVETEPEAEPADELPAWLLEDEAAPAETVVEAEEVEAEPEAELVEELPAWLLEDETAPPEAVAEVEEVEAEPEAEPADELPAWLLEDEAVHLEAVAEIEEVETEPEAEPAEELPAWLLEDEAAHIEAVAKVEEVEAEPEAEPADELPAWLLEDEAAQLEAVAEIEEVETEPEAEPADELPAWLLEDEAAPAETVAEVEEVKAEPEAEPAEELPDWLLEDEAAQIEAVAEIEEVETEAEAEPVETLAEAEEVEAESEAEPADELPSWLLEDEAAQLEAIVEIDEVEIELEAEPANELPAWLLGDDKAQPEMVAKVDAEVEKFKTDPTEEIPAFLRKDVSKPAEVAKEEMVPEAEPVEELPAFLRKDDSKPAEVEEDEVVPQAEPAGELSDWQLEDEEALPEVVAEVEEVEDAEVAKLEVEPSLDDDAAFAWLESLAVKQGADEALLLSPKERLDAPPDWVLEAAEEAAKTPAEPAAPTPEAFEAEAVADIDEQLEAGEPLPDWLAAKIEPETVSAPEAIEPEAISAEKISAQPDAEDTKPDWLAEDFTDAGEAQEEPILGDTQPTLIDQPPPAEFPTPAEPLTHDAPEKPHTGEQEYSISAEQVSEIDDTDAAFAWLESLAVRQGADEALLLSPEERQETPPEWVQQAAGEITEAEDSELAEEDAAVEQAYDERGALDADEAFAWLESLAVRQGAEEALLLSPEERREMPPEWVQKEPYNTAHQDMPEAPAEVETPDDEYAEDVPLSAETTVTEPLPETPSEPSAEDWMAALEGEESDGNEQIEAIQTLAEEPVYPDDAGFEEGVQVAEELPVEAQEPTADISELDSETGQAQAAIPALPDWLSAEPPSGSTDKLEWKLPPVRSDINKASLAEFEKLPGIGFILAQRIINHRENLGEFIKVEDLLEVPGFSQFILDGLGDRLYVEAQPEPEPKLQLATPKAPEKIIIYSSQSATEELTAAREALNQGNLSQALEGYASLINASQSIPDVIHDLQEASSHYPEDISVWQHLGDAYLRDNQAKQALQAYIEAEKLLR